MRKVLSVVLLGIGLCAQTAAAATVFTDVHTGSQYADSIHALADAGVVMGYPDGTFRPSTLVNRAEFLTLAYRAQGLDLSYAGAPGCFPDVPQGKWFTLVVCAAKNAGYISGYPDGSFHPERPIALNEAAKIMVNIAGLNIGAQPEGTVWYVPFLKLLADNKYLPPSLNSIVQQLRRDEVAEILMRIRGQIHDRESTPFEGLSKRPCQPIGDETDSRFDMDRLRAVWVGWMNEVRSDAGLPGYAESRQLDRSATTWAKFMRNAGGITHRRHSGDTYYDYAQIGAWLSAQGITAKAVGNIAYAETIGWSTLSCKETDCTDEMLVPLRAIFDLYLKEKGETPGTFARSHYESVVNPAFTQIGLGLALSGDKVYITTHYVTSITSDPAPVCH